jgi:hypothetical protein
MTSDLSILAARIRDFIIISADEFDSVHLSDPAFRTHADAEFNGMALMLFALQWQHNAPYRKICEARKITSNSVHHWTQIPAVPASAFKELDLTSLAVNARTRVFHSSGTTGQKPSRHFHNAESLALYETSLLPWFRRHVPLAKRLAILTPPPVQAPNSSLVHMLETIRLKCGSLDETFLGNLADDGSWVVDFKRTIRALENASRANEPVILLGTAFSLVHLLDQLVENDLRFQLPRESRVMETGGYKNRSRVIPRGELHDFIANRLGVPAEGIVCEYGMSELSSQAYAHALAAPGRQPADKMAAARVFQFPPWVRTRIVSPETERDAADGETGLLRIFDLANVFSVMAIQTEDLAIRRGDGFELIGRAKLSEPRGCSLMSLPAGAIP